MIRLFKKLKVILVRNKRTRSDQKGPKPGANCTNIDITCTLYGAFDFFITF